MLKQLPPKTRLVAAIIALLGVAVFAVVALKPGKNGAPYVPNYPYMPTQTDDEPNPTTDGPFKCGEPVDDTGRLPDGWTTESNRYLCLSVSHPANWRLIEPRNALAIGQAYPMMLQEAQAGQVERPVANIYPLEPSASLDPFITESLAEIRSERPNIGTDDLPVYEFALAKDPASEDKLLQYFLVDARAQDRVYLIVGYHPKDDVTEARQADVRRMALELSAY